MKPYCMTVVKYVLPAMRVLVMNELIEKYGFQKSDIAKKMSISPSAITQYLKGERGSNFIKEISKSDDVINMLSDVSKDIANEKDNLDFIIDKMCEVCKLLRMKGIVCELHREEFSELCLSDCELCLKGE